MSPKKQSGQAPFAFAHCEDLHSLPAQALAVEEKLHGGFAVDKRPGYGQVYYGMPGYGLLRSLTQRLAGDRNAEAWKPALVELEDALVPAFIIEELDDGRFTVFVPSVPTPFAGAVYVLSPERVHVVDVPFTQAVRTISQWGSGSRNLVAAMKKGEEAI